MSDTRRLLQASIDLIEKDQEIERLNLENRQLQCENKLLPARIDWIALRRLKASQGMPALLRVQA